MKPKKKKKLKLSINSRKLVLKPSTEAIVVNKCVNIGPTTLKKVKLGDETTACFIRSLIEL